MPESSAPSTDPDVSPPSPATILYSPGINEFSGQGFIDGFAEQVSRTLDHQDPDIAAVYSVKVVASEPYSNGTAFSEVREIIRQTPGRAEEVTHRIYNLDYSPLIDAEQTQKNLVTQALAVARVWAWMACQFLRRFPTVTSLGRAQKLALVIGGAALLPTRKIGYDHAGRKQLDIADAVFGGAFLAHSQYWVPGDARAESCFSLLVPEIYPSVRTPTR